MKNNELEQIRREIALLPPGYLSKKTIYGKERYYLQWTENGKKKSKYIDEATAKDLQVKIERRRELQKKEKELLANHKENEPKSIDSGEHRFKTNVIYGDELSRFVSFVKEFKKRRLFRDIQDFIYGSNHTKVLILYGLRRTGKTTLIRQTIAEMNEKDFSEAVFMQITPGIELSDVNEDLKTLLKLGFKYVFIDEVTLLSDFIEGAALFSDIYASCGMKIVLSGTDSLGFFFAEDEQLYDRSIFVHTTFIPYKEFEEVLGIKGIDEYIRYGGTMSLGGVRYNDESTFASKESTDEYVDSAIAKNIQHSLKHYQNGNHFRALYSLYEKNELTSVINRVVEDTNHRFTLDVLTRDFLSHDLGISARNLRKDRAAPNDILDHIDKALFTKRLKKALEIKNKDEQAVKINEEHQLEIKEYLDALGLTNDIEVRSLPVGDTPFFKTVFVQPGIRFAQAYDFVRSLLLDKAFQNLPLIERNAIIDRILNDIKGRMMEDIVLLETKIANPKKQVFQLHFAVGEFDMVIADEETSTCEIFEIKHSQERVPEQYRHLIDEGKLAKTELRYGRITKRAVVYRGDDFTLDNGIQYLNVERYLKSLY